MREKKFRSLAHALVKINLPGRKNGRNKGDEGNREVNARREVGTGVSG